jgi:hypothetical protein
METSSLQSIQGVDGNLISTKYSGCRWKPHLYKVFRVQMETSSLQSIQGVDGNLISRILKLQQNT